MSLDLTPNMVVREAMSSPVVTIQEDEKITQAAKLMRDQKIGAVVVTSYNGQPIGIVTERDIVIRVVASNHFSEDVKVKDVMSSPLRVVNADTPLLTAMQIMDKMNIRRLGITYKGNLVGIISDRNIIRIMPTIVDIIRESSIINNSENTSSQSTIGYCDRCELYSTNLKMVDGEFLCEDCRAENE